MINCKRCGKDNLDQHKFCLRCGGELEAPPAALARTMMADSVTVTAPPPVTTAAGSASGPTTRATAQQSASVAGVLLKPTPFRPPPRSDLQPAPLPGMPPAQRQVTGSPSVHVDPSLHTSPTMLVSPTPPAYAPPAPPAYAPPAPPAYAPPAAYIPPAAPAPMPAQVTTPSSTRACTTCGTELPASFLFCGACGSRLAPLTAPAPPPPEPEPEPARPRGHMTLIRPDGSEGGTFELDEGENLIGRDHGDRYANDNYISPLHAVLTLESDAMRVRDLDSFNGVFVKLTEEAEVRPGDHFRVGQHILRLDTLDTPPPLDDGTEIMGSPNPGYWGRLVVVLARETDGAAFPLLGDAITIGRDRGDINFRDDGYVSGNHARLLSRDGRYFLSDLGSSNGTFVRIHDEHLLGDGDMLLVGQQLYRLAFTPA